MDNINTMDNLAMGTGRKEKIAVLQAIKAGKLKPGQVKLFKVSQTPGNSPVCTIDGVPVEAGMYWQQREMILSGQTEFVLLDEPGPQLHPTNLPDEIYI